MDNVEDRRTRQDPNRPEPNLLAIPPPNKWRGSKIKVYDKDVIQAQKQEKSTRNLRKAQSRKDEIRPELEQTTEGSSSAARVDSRASTSAPGNVANGRYIYATRNGLISYGVGRNGLKTRKKKINASGPTGPTTPPRLAKLPRSPQTKDYAIKSRAHGSPKKKSPISIRKRKKPETDSEEECGRKPKRRSLAIHSERPEEKGQKKRRLD